MSHTPDRNQTATQTPAAAGLGLALVVVAIFIVYLPALGGTLVWNDSDYVTSPELRSPAGLARIWFDVGATEQYYPLLHSFFWIQSQLWGDAPLGYHLVNLALHAIAVCLLYFILRRLQIPGALLAAAIFALHPVMVESVAWITEQKNTLSTVFYLAALGAYLHFDQARKPAWYALALALYLLAMASKTVTATLPAALLVIFWWQRGRLSWKRDVLPLIPWFVLGIGAGLFTAWVERNYIGAQGAAFDLTLTQRLLIAGRVPWFYAATLLWPVNLIFMYPRWEVDPRAWLPWLFPLATAALLGALWFGRRRGRGPLACCLLFIGTLAPVLGFLNVYWFVFSFAADHLQYLASLALIVLVAAGLALARNRLPPKGRWIGNALLLAMLGLLGTLTWLQAPRFHDVFALYQTTIAHNPNCWMAYNNLGLELGKKGNAEAAYAQFRKASEINPNFPEGHYNLGNALAKISRLPEAIEQYELALQLRPDYAEAHTNLAIALMSAGRPQEAIEQYREAVHIKPDSLEAQNNLGNALARLGRPAEAVEHLEAAVRLKPDSALIHNNLGATLADLGRFPEAIERYQQAIQLEPAYAHAYFNLAKALAKLNHSAEAVAAARKGLELAQAADRTTLIKQIEAWLKNYSAGAASPAKESSGPKPIRTTP